MYFSWNGAGSSDFSSTAHMWPGTNYEISFTMRLSAGSAGNRRFKYKFGNQGWSNEMGILLVANDPTPFGPHGVGAFNMGNRGLAQPSRPLLSLLVEFIVEHSLDLIETSLKTLSSLPATPVYLLALPPLLVNA